MKKIIANKLYDTSTAKKVGMYANPGNWNDFNHLEEALYQKRTGEYFLHGEGGAATKYAERVEQNSWSGGEQIIPLSYAAAREWAEERLDADVFMSVFGPVAEGDDASVALNTNLSAAASDQLRRMAAERGLSIRATLEQLIAAAR